MPVSRKPAAKAAARRGPTPKAMLPVLAEPAATVVEAVKAIEAVKRARPATAGQPDKADKAADKSRKAKLVRDSFTMPKSEYAVLETLKLRAAQLGRPVKKSQVLRAGVMALADMGDAAFLASVTGVPALKTGRPAKATT
jgi:hypothetical protein